MIPALRRVASGVGCLLLAACASGSDVPTVHIAQVIDGDTVETDRGERIRLLELDAPETHDGEECYGAEAYAALRTMLLDQTVEVELDLDVDDDFQRTLAYLYLNGRMVNEALLADGLACLLVLPPNDRYAAYLGTVEEAARRAGTGLWSACGGCDTSL